LILVTNVTLGRILELTKSQQKYSDDKSIHYQLTKTFIDVEIIWTIKKIMIIFFESLNIILY